MRIDNQELYDILSHTILYDLMNLLDDSIIPNHYIAAGSIAQSVWNATMGFAPEYGIHDIDIIYFDQDTSAEKESAVKATVHELTNDLHIPVDVVNQARVHLWYGKESPLFPLKSAEEGINLWVPATSIGVKLHNKRFTVYAPYGLFDMFSMIIRPNKLVMSEEYYIRKGLEWKSKWNDLRVFPWNTNDCIH